VKSIDLSRELGAAAIGTLGQAFRLDRAAQQSGILRRELPDLDLHIVNYGTLFGYLLLPERCVPSARPYRGLLDLDYPFHDRTVTVTTCGRICFNRQKINLSTVFAGQSVGIRQVSEQIWLVSFMDYDLGYFDQETCRLEPIENPFGPKVLPMSPE